MTPNTRRGCGLPPQYPYYRRGSNVTPISSLALNSSPPAPPNRSRSLDGLLDSSNSNETVIAKTTAEDSNPSECAGTNNSKQITKSCDDIDSIDVTSSCNNYNNEPSTGKDTETNNLKVKSYSLDDLDSSVEGVNNDCGSNQQDQDESSICSSSSEKRKRNFMDRCVNKVRSLIKK